MTGLAHLQPSVSRFRQAARDLFLLVATFALLGAQALSTLHFVLVPHHLCSVHGVLEDAEPGVRAERRTAEHSTAVVSAGESGSDSHEACSVATRAEHGVLPERAALADIEPNEASVSAGGPGVSLARERAELLSSAPKTSPPAQS